jgi:hypothetical protein
MYLSYISLIYSKREKNYLVTQLRAILRFRSFKAHLDLYFKVYLSVSVRCVTVFFIWYAKYVLTSRMLCLFFLDRTYIFTTTCM